MSAPPDYHPTPREDAYTSYILETVFDLDFNIPAIKISGREAVTFLSKSAVHRLILRNLWTTVDPTSAGALLHRHQLATLLRCVALAQYPSRQDSLLNAALQVAYNDEQKPVEAIRACLLATAQKTDIPLATFEGIPVPSNVTLKPYMKGEDVGQDQNETVEDDFGNFTAGSAASPQPMATATATMTTSQQQQGWGAFDGLSDNGEAAGMGQTMGGMASQQPQQLTSMGMMQQQPSSGMMQQQPIGVIAQQASATPQTSDWGAFDSLTSVPSQQPQPQMPTMQAPSDDFGEFNAAPPAMQPFQQVQAPNNEFGAFGSAPVESFPPSQAAPEPSGWDALDALASSTPEMPPPTLPGASSVSTENNQPQSNISTELSLGNPPPSQTSGATDDFGSFTSSSQPQPATQASGWDALDAFASSSTAPAAPTLSTAPVAAMEPHISSQTNDDFGDFESSPAGTPGSQQQTSFPMGDLGASTHSVLPVGESAPVPSMSETQQPTTNLGGFNSFQQTSIQKASPPVANKQSGWNAFDSLATAAPAPSPILPDPTNVTSPLTPQVEADTPKSDAPASIDDDDFGDFASTTAQQPQETSGWGALDALTGSLDAPPPTLANLSSTDPEEAIQTPQVNTATSEAPIPVNDDDDFGDFASSGRVEGISADQPSNGAPVSAHFQQASSELDASTSVANDSTVAVPIHQAEHAISSSDPTLSAKSIGSSGPLNGGEFVSSTEFNMVSQPETTQDDGPSGWGGFDALASRPVSPPSLTSPLTDDFGDFASKAAQPASEEDDSAVAESAGLDAMATQEAENDEFGDFESNSALPQSQPALGSSSLTESTLNNAGTSVRSADEPFLTPKEPKLPQPTGNLERTVSLSPPPEERSGIPNIPKGDSLNTVRSDSAFYTARSSSMAQSEVSSLDDFVDAVESSNDLGKPRHPMSAASSEIQQTESNGPALDSDDPFAAFDTLAPSQQDLPPLSSFESKDSNHETSVGQVDDVGTDSLIMPSQNAMQVGESTGQPPVAADEIAVADDFDDFGDFEGVEPESSRPGDTAMSQPGQPVGTVEDDFGDFAAASLQGKVSEGLQPSKHETQVDLFGNFSAPPVSPDNQARATVDMFGAFSSQKNANQISESIDAPASGGGDFFDAFAPPASAAVEKAVLATDDDFGAFSTPAADDPVQQAGIAAEDDFGEFSAPATVVPLGGKAATVNDNGFVQTNAPIRAPPVEDEFGDFAASTRSVNVDDDFGNFGDFASAESQLSTTDEPPNASKPPIDSKDSQSDKSVDGFGDFDAVPTHNALSDDSGDDWDAFQEASQKKKRTPKKNDPETDNLFKIREFILAAAAHVPESLLQCTNGDHVDFASCFEANIGVEVPVSADRKKRMQRCLRVATLLSTERSKLASAYWSAAMSTAKEELTHGLSLCTETRAMSKKCRQAVTGPLEKYINGLGEIVRVIRMIVATIGDLLMLDDSSLFTVDTLASSWCSLAILGDALEIERLWKSASEEATKLGITSKGGTKYNLSSISELRRTSSVTISDSEYLCQFTLQPFVKDCETTNQVEWGERCFMACTANFLANKCTFFSYDD